MPLHLVKGTPAPETSAERVRQRLRQAPKPADMLQCPRCAGREVVETRVGVSLIGGKPRGGTKQILCALCLTRGERVVLA